MRHSRWENLVSIEKKETITREILELARKKMLTVHADKRNVPLELAFALIALYVQPKRGREPQAPYPTKQDIGFLDDLPTQNVSDRLRSIRFLQTIISNQIRQRHLTIEPVEGQGSFKKKQTIHYRVRANKT